MANIENVTIETPTPIEVNDPKKDGEYYELKKDEYTTLIAGLAKYKKLYDDAVKTIKSEKERSEKLEKEIEMLKKTVEKIEEKQK